jgi:hypothetical protein
VAADISSDLRFNFSPPHTHQKKCERYIQVIKERYVIICSTLLEHGVGKLLYVLVGYLFQYIVDCLNIAPGTVTAPHTPMFLFSGRLCTHNLLQQSNGEFLQPVLIRNYQSDTLNPNSIAFFLGRSKTTLNAALVWLPGSTIITRQIEKKIKWDPEVLRLYHNECTHIHCAKTSHTPILNTVPECPQFTVSDPSTPSEISAAGTVPPITPQPTSLDTRSCTDTNDASDANTAIDQPLSHDGVPEIDPVIRRSDIIAQQQVADVSLGQALKLWPLDSVNAAINKELTNLAVNLTSWDYVHKITDVVGAKTSQVLNAKLSIKEKVDVQGITKYKARLCDVGNLLPESIVVYYVCYTPMETSNHEK